MSAADDYPYPLGRTFRGTINEQWAAMCNEIDRLRVAVDAARRWIDATPATDEWVGASDAFVRAVVQMDDPYRHSMRFTDALKLLACAPDEVNEEGS